MGGRERNRCCKRGEEKPSSPTFVQPREEDGVQCRQNSIVLLRFFQRIVSETTSFCTKCVVSLKKKHQKVSISKSVLNWDFDFKNQFNCIPVKFNYQPWSWPHFFTLVLGFEFLYFDPQFINKLSISSIWPMIWSISVPIFTHLFQFGPWFWISSIKFLIVHQTSIFMQLSP